MLISKYCKERLNTIAGILNEDLGLDIYEKSRRRECVTGRMIASWQLYNEGISVSTIGSLIGKNHSTVIFYIERMKNVIDVPGYEAELEIWKLFKEKLDEYDANRTSTAD